MVDLISRQAALNALWQALYEYEAKTEKQFQESDDLDIGDWIEHKIFVQNMNDIDRRTILSLPSALPERKGKWNPIKTRPLNDEEIKLWAEQHGCKCEEYGEGDDYMCDDYMCLPPLPRDGEEVLICDASGNIGFYTFHIASQFELGMYDEEDEDRPVAWMSLPEPYKEEEKWKSRDID